jgi:hypothetical protein
VSNADETIEAGAIAWGQIRRVTSFESWRATALAVAVGRQHALREANTNKPYGAKYSAAIVRWLEANGFREMPAGIRTACCIIADHAVEIDRWRASLPDSDQRAQNNPQVIIRNWRRATAPNRTATARPHIVKEAMAKGYTRAVHCPADALRRAATAIREARSGDCIVLARRALESAVRDENDLRALLPDPPATSTPRRSIDNNSAPAAEARA